MAKKKKKFYVVWKGRQTGIFENWDDCQKQVSGFAGAKHKAFNTRTLAEKAFIGNSSDYIGKNTFESELAPEQLKQKGRPILESISVDGAWNTATGAAEYQGVDTKTKKLLFGKGPFEDGTNNTMEFLGIVHALAYCEKNNIDVPIYSDSKIAIGWVRDKEARTDLIKNERNKKIFELLDRAVHWLKTHPYKNKVLKWETRAWGENPADFGRK